MSRRWCSWTSPRWAWITFAREYLHHRSPAAGCRPRFYTAPHGRAERLCDRLAIMDEARSSPWALNQLLSEPAAPGHRGAGLPAVDLAGFRPLPGCRIERLKRSADLANRAIRMLGPLHQSLGRYADSVSLEIAPLSLEASSCNSREGAARLTWPRHFALPLGRALLLCIVRPGYAWRLEQTRKVLEQAGTISTVEGAQPKLTELSTVAGILGYRRDGWQAWTNTGASSLPLSGRNSWRCFASIPAHLCAEAAALRQARLWLRRRGDGQDGAWTQDHHAATSSGGLARAEGGSGGHGHQDRGSQPDDELPPPADRLLSKQRRKRS